jgi:dTDP-glucose 4,6-dehydratase
VNVLVTGGAGFIGSSLVHLLLRQGETVLNLDKLSYAGNIASLAEIADDPRHRFRQMDLSESAELCEAVAEFEPEIVVHLAAETHVDRSIDAPRAFIESNVVGTYNLLQACLQYWSGLKPALAARFRLLHASTDEVYGSLGPSGNFSETTRYEPHSPYAASKAASDHLARAWRHTYGLPVIVSTCSNNFGPRQHPEKLIPASIVRALSGEPILIYGRGDNVRDWIYVDDHCEALWAAATRGTLGETYNIGGSNEQRNIDLVQMLCKLLDKLRPRSGNRSYTEQIAFVSDRPGHDFRYAVDAEKIRRELGWQPQHQWAAALEQTVAWYLANEEWWRPLVSEALRQRPIAQASPERPANV